MNCDTEEQDWLEWDAARPEADTFLTFYSAPGALGIPYADENCHVVEHSPKTLEPKESCETPRALDVTPRNESSELPSYQRQQGLSCWRPLAWHTWLLGALILLLLLVAAGLLVAEAVTRTSADTPLWLSGTCNVISLTAGSNEDIAESCCLTAVRFQPDGRLQDPTVATRVVSVAACARADLVLPEESCSVLLESQFLNSAYKCTVHDGPMPPATRRMYADSSCFVIGDIFIMPDAVPVERLPCITPIVEAKAKRERTGRDVTQRSGYILLAVAACCLPLLAISAITARNANRRAAPSTPSAHTPSAAAPAAARRAPRTATAPRRPSTLRPAAVAHIPQNVSAPATAREYLAAGAAPQSPTAPGSAPAPLAAHAPRPASPARARAVPPAATTPLAGLLSGPSSSTGVTPRGGAHPNATSPSRGAP